MSDSSEHTSVQEQRVLTVTELNATARAVIEQGMRLLWVGGEVSGFTRAASGHWYFTLKDAQAQVRCVMFRHRNQLLDWNVGNGAQVEARAVPTIYEARGDFQLAVEFMRPAGLGALFEQFERLKRKLESEGLFDASRKRELPAFPKTVGVVTSPKGAAIRDVIATLRKRMPPTAIVLYPTLVQGESAPAQIVNALKRASDDGRVEVIILCRGGGSIEDLWSFNDEAVARAIAGSRVPVVSGVGHETDFTIADFVADRRAPTPTGAAMLVVPDRADLMRQVASLADRLRNRWWRGQERRMQRLDLLARQLKHPGERVRHQQQMVAQLRSRMTNAQRRNVEALGWRVQAAGQTLRGAAPNVDAMRRGLTEIARRLRFAPALRLERADQRLKQLEAALTHLNPQGVLARGFSIVRSKAGHVVTDAATLNAGAHLDITFARGEVDAEVKRVTRD